MCRQVDAIIESICRDPLNRKRCIASLAFLLLLSVEEPVGRPYASRVLDIGEKMLRNIYSELVEKGLVEKTRAGAYLSRHGKKLLESLEIARVVGDKCLCIVACDRESLEVLSRKVLLLRDEVVISLEDPYLLEVIGFVQDKSVFLPGVEEPILSQYLYLLSSTMLRDPSILGIFYSSCYKCCSSLIYSIYSILRT